MDNVIGIITANYATPDLGCLTEERAVASLPYAGRYRLIDFPLSNMVNSGITSVGVITPYKYRSLMDHIGSGKAWSLDRKNGGLFILPGSAFGISANDYRFLLRDIIRNKAYLSRTHEPYVLVASSHIIFNMNFEALCKDHFESGADITMVYSELKEDSRYLSSLKMDGDRVTRVNKGAKAGDKAFLDCFIIARDVLLKIMEWYEAIDHLDLFDILQQDYDKMYVRGFACEQYVGSIFSVQEFYARSMELLTPDIYRSLFLSDAPVITKPQDYAPSKYCEGAVVKNSLVTDGCVIEGTVENSVLARGVTVARGAVVKNSIILQACRIEAGAHVEHAVLDRGNIVRTGSVIKGTASDIFVVPKAEI